MGRAEFGQRIGADESRDVFGEGKAVGGMVSGVAFRLPAVLLTFRPLGPPCGGEALAPVAVTGGAPLFEEFGPISRRGRKGWRLEGWKVGRFGIGRLEGKRKAVGGRWSAVV